VSLVSESADRHTDELTCPNKYVFLQLSEQCLKEGILTRSQTGTASRRPRHCRPAARQVLRTCPYRSAARQIRWPRHCRPAARQVLRACPYRSAARQVRWPRHLKTSCQTGTEDVPLQTSCQTGTEVVPLETSCQTDTEAPPYQC
jgi:hypothetical protein